MKLNKVELVAFIALIVVLAVVLTGCNTVAGVGRDIQGSAEWTKDKINKDAAK